MEYNSFKKTALRRKELSRPMRELLKRDLLTGRVLDFACGWGTDLKTLMEQNIDIVGYDKYNVVFSGTEVLQNRYDTITCNYMFNVIPTIEEHREMVDLLRSLSDNVYIAVRSDEKAIKPTWKYDVVGRGFWTPKGSYQRFYTNTMIYHLFGKVEYIVNDSSMKLFRLREI